MNIKIRELKITITNHLKAIGLPAEINRLVLKEIYEEISAEADSEIRKELSEMEQKGDGNDE